MLSWHPCQDDADYREEKGCASEDRLQSREARLGSWDYSNKQREERCER